MTITEETKNNKKKKKSNQTEKINNMKEKENVGKKWIMNIYEPKIK